MHAFFIYLSFFKIFYDYKLTEYDNDYCLSINHSIIHAIYQQV
jgi:hypothetical protein